MRPATTTPYGENEAEAEGSVDLLRLVVIFLAEWRLGLACALLVFLIGAAFTYTTRSQFEASATLLPKQASEESTSLSAIFSGKRPSDVFVGLLTSRSVVDLVIARLHLLERYHLSSMESAREMLRGGTRVTVGADSLVTITVRNPDAREAAEIANAYVDALQQQQESMALTQSVVHRRFFEAQMEQEREALANAEQALKQTQERSGVVQAETQTQIGLGAIAGIRSQIAGLRVQLAALLQSATEANPQVQTLRSQIAQAEAQERSLEAGSSGGAGAAAAAGRMPELNLEYARRQREVRYHEGLLNSLSNQYETARLSEASGVDVFQVLDRAIVPERKVWPPRQLYLLLSAAFGLLAGLIAIMLKLFSRRLLRDPLHREHLLTIRRNFSVGRR